MSGKDNFLDLFSKPKPVIAMIHLQALPGTPAYRGDDQFILDTALQEAEVFAKAGVDALMLENMHDVPYLKRKVGPEITAMITAIAAQVKTQSGLPCGLQILAGANIQALAAAKAARLDFIRAEGFVYGHLADEGYIESDAGNLLRYRKQIAAEDIFILTDIKKKHSSHALTSDVDIIETAKTAEYFRSDGLIITGHSTATTANMEEVESVKSNVKLPVLLGSGLSIANLKSSMTADGFIVGSTFKQQGIWNQALDHDRINAFMDEVHLLRSKARV